MKDNIYKLNCFAEFWNHYPIKTNRDNLIARRIWVRFVDDDFCNEIVEASKNYIERTSENLQLPILKWMEKFIVMQYKDKFKVKKNG